MQQPPPGGYPPQAFPPLAAKPVREKNVLGLISFIVAIVGFIFACIPGALVVGWILLPIAFILALVALFLKDKSKTFAVTGLIISIVGTVVGVLVFLVVASDAFDDALSGGEATVITPEGQAKGTDEADDAQAGRTEEAGDEKGTRASPYPIGSAITQDDWTVTINSVDLDATAEVTAGNQMNDEPDAGMVYIMVNLTATYNGTDPEGDTAWVTVDYVTEDGNTISSTDKFVVEPDPFDSLATLYEGASTTGNKALQVPADTAASGVLAVSPTMMSDKVFVAVE